MVQLERQNFKKNKQFYNKILQDLRKNINDSIPINHVGSTAIPNMYGKNILDILIGAEDIKEFNKLKGILESKGFIASKNSKDNIYQFFASNEGETSSGDIHIHLVIKNTERYKEFLILRDYLLNNKDEARNYSNYKRKLIKDGITIRKEYKVIKSKYVTDLIIRAKQHINYK